MPKPVKPIISEARKQFLKACIAKQVILEIGFWLERSIQQPWDKKAVKGLVKIYWGKCLGTDDEWMDYTALDWDLMEKEVEKNDKYDGIHFESEYQVWFLIEQVGYACEVRLNDKQYEKQLATITTTDIANMVLEQRGLI
jgi:hypothetical protein